MDRNDALVVMPVGLTVQPIPTTALDNEEKRCLRNSQNPAIMVRFEGINRMVSLVDLDAVDRRQWGVIRRKWRSK